MNEAADRGSRRALSRRVAVKRGAMLAGAAAGMEWAGPSTASGRAAQTEATPTAGSVPDDFQVVLHAAEIENWDFVLSNLRNLTQEWPRARLRVVVDGSAVRMLQGENDLTHELGDMADKGVQIQVCPNALRDQDIDRATVPAYAQTTLGGVVALVLAQQEGYAYVKP